ncbi:ArnT family glycosyltransferase [Glacieibacterium frigidum]|uniref:Glycosyltransferase RgtA/B/C/D-like domain-containing protein n=1 Tax=Glacieibacterium frigidum TaxID=2593303 RepID=A0A552UI73_9SPHN|nr:glycosyltransferase family 39 protein [Glacieibacterium frigidum]TRW17925.1 hypothetical protein FMM06_07305 [Glacieibacterium frigidum]
MTARRDAVWFAALLIGTAVLLALDPPGYFGGRWDDARYLEAALQWVEAPNLGTVHWSLRWPVVLPAWGALEAFGRTRFAAMVPGLAAFAALLIFSYWAARRVLGGAAALLACAMLVTTSEILFAATRLTADLPELLFMSVGAWSFILAARAGGGAQTRWLIACGVAAGLAFAVRETAASLMVVLGLLWLTGVGVPRRAYLWIALGFLCVWLPEQLILWHASGDPLYRLHVDMRHVEVPSTNLQGLVAGGSTPAMNPQMMARWIGVGPLRIHYLVDPWLNLFLNGRYGLVFLIAGIAVLFAGRRLRGREGRTVVILAGLAAAHIAFVIYVIATDPKPRMFMPAILCGCLIAGVALPLAWRGRTRIVLALLGVAKLVVLLVTIDITAVYKTQYEELTQRVLARVPGPVHADRWTLSTLALADAATRARLVTGAPPPGGFWLTIASLKNAHGDEKPPQGYSWRVVARAEGPRKPVIVHLAAPLLTPGSKLAAVARNPTPVATLWQRVPVSLPAR